MNASAVEEKMEKIFRSVFAEYAQASGGEIRAASRMATGTWDSANHLMLILCIEEEFALHVPDETGVAIESFLDAVNAVHRCTEEKT